MKSHREFFAFDVCNNGLHELTTIRFLFIRSFTGYVGKRTNQEASPLAGT